MFDDHGLFPPVLGFAAGAGIAGKVCGVKSFYVPRSHPDGYSVNVRCIDPGSIEQVEIELFDDNDRRAAEARFRDRSRDD